MQCSDDGAVPWERTTSIPVPETARQFIATAVVQVVGVPRGCPQVSGWPDVPKQTAVIEYNGDFRDLA
jgi:hypothetical protein